MHYKICVYAIAKDEETFVDRFCDAAAQADYIAVLDTGSTDATVERLRARGCIVRREVIMPWRFDAARNKSMELIPEDADICVCLDLDEVLLPGWREALEAAWTRSTLSGRFTNIRSRNGDGTPGTVFLQRKLHRPGAFRWKYPVHEVLVSAENVPVTAEIAVPDMAVEHRPDRGKSRGQYLPLLELAARENPEDARCAHYLGREYMYYGRWDEAIRELRRHLALPSAVWREERCATMRYLSRCCAGKGDAPGAMRWAMRAVCEQPELREGWYEAQRAAYELRDWSGVCYYGEHTAAITSRSDTCINEGEAWGAGVHDLLSLAYWNLGRPDKALASGELALALAPEDRRIRKNLEYYKEARSRCEQRPWTGARDANQELRSNCVCIPSQPEPNRSPAKRVRLGEDEQRNGADVRRSAGRSGMESARTKGERREHTRPQAGVSEANRPEGAALRPEMAQRDNKKAVEP